MPIYEYHCEHCEHHLELLQKISDEPLQQCPECQHTDFHKIISKVGFRLKGGGWYETDFKASADKRNLADHPKDATAATAANEALPATAAVTSSSDKKPDKNPEPAKQPNNAT